MARAYLIMKMKVVRGIPRFREVRIYSQQASSMTVHIVDEFYVDIISADGNNYGEAERKLVAWIKLPSFPYQWVKPFFQEMSGKLFEPVVADVLIDKALEEEENPLNIALEHMGEIP